MSQTNETSFCLCFACVLCYQNVFLTEEYQKERNTLSEKTWIQYLLHIYQFFIILASLSVHRVSYHDIPYWNESYDVLGNNMESGKIFVASYRPLSV
jgi:hypothetical protein